MNSQTETSVALETASPPTDPFGKGRKRQASGGDDCPSPASSSKKRDKESNRSEQQESRKKDKKNYEMSDEALKKILERGNSVLEKFPRIHAILGIQNKDSEAKKVILVERTTRMSDKIANQSNAALDLMESLFNQTANLLNILEDKNNRNVQLVPGDKTPEGDSENTRRLKNIEEMASKTLAIVQQREQNDQKTGEALQNLLNSSTSQDQTAPTYASPHPGPSETVTNANIDFDFGSTNSSNGPAATDQFGTLPTAGSNENDPNDPLQYSTISPEVLALLGINGPQLLDPYQYTDNNGNGTGGQGNGLQE